MMRVVCGRCGKKFHITDRELANLYLGDKIKCPNCGRMVGLKK